MIDTIIRIRVRDHIQGGPVQQMSAAEREFLQSGGVQFRPQSTPGVTSSKTRSHTYGNQQLLGKRELQERKKQREKHQEKYLGLVRKKVHEEEKVRKRRA